MIRRQFIKLATLTGATGLASMGTLEALESKETKTVHWHITGFTCITCAVGLETMLRQHKGVKAADASYPDSAVAIRFYPEEVSEADLRDFITGIGFKAEEQKG